MLLNGIFAMCEMALVSSKKARLAEKASKGNKNAVLVLQLIDNPDKFLSAIQDFHFAIYNLQANNLIF